MYVHPSIHFFVSLNVCLTVYSRIYLLIDQNQTNQALYCSLTMGRTVLIMILEWYQLLGF